MRELAKKIVDGLTNQIQELEEIDASNKEFIQKAFKNKTTLQSVVDKRMKLAGEQLNLLKLLKAKKEYFETTYLR